MAAQQNILREYLVALGFRVNETQERRMGTALDKMDKRVLGLGKAAVGAAVAVVTVTTALAKSWERMFYSARYADTTVEKLQSLEYGARSVGLEAGKMTATVKQFAAAIRANPGLQGLLESLGVQVTGRTKDKVLTDFLRAIKDQPTYIQNGFARMFGIDPETLFNLEEGLEDLEKARAIREQMNRDAGLDADAAAKVGQEYMNMWRQVEARAGVFAQTIMVSVLPQVRDLVSETDKLLLKWTLVVKDIHDYGGWDRFWDGITGKAHGGERAVLSEQARERLGMPKRDEPGPRAGSDKPGSSGDVLTGFDKYMRWRESHGPNARDYDPRVATDPEAVDAVQDMDSFKRGGTGTAPPAGAGRRQGKARELSPEEAAYFEALEKKYNLPPGLMDRVYLKESSRGANVVGPLLKDGTRAMGPFQMKPDTAAQYGVSDPLDFRTSADGSARMFRDLLAKYGGDLEMAAVAYNWGQGRLERQGLGKIPEESKDYARAVAGDFTLQQDVNIHVHGSGDPHATAAAVAREQKGVGSDLVRNFSAKVR